MPEPVRYGNKGAQSGIGMFRYWTEIQDAGLPMPAASSSMPMLSYVSFPVSSLIFKKSLERESDPLISICNNRMVSNCHYLKFGYFFPSKSIIRKK